MPLRGRIRTARDLVRTVQVIDIPRLWIIAVLGGAGQLHSQHTVPATVLWTGLQNNDMSQNFNWSPQQVPSSGANAYFQQNVVFGSTLEFVANVGPLQWTTATFDSSPNFVVPSEFNLTLFNGVTMGRSNVTPVFKISGNVWINSPTVVIVPQSGSFPQFEIEDGGILYIVGENAATQSFVNYTCRDEGRIIYRGGALGGGANILMQTTGVGGIDTDGSITLGTITSPGEGGQIQIRSGTLRIEGGNPLIPFSDLGLSQIFGAGGIAVAGTTVSIRTDATYTGTTQILGEVRPGVVPLNGVLRLRDQASLSGSVVELGSTPENEAAGILSVETNATIRGLGGSGNVQFAPGNILTVDQSSSTSYEGQIAGNGTLSKLGGGTLTLLGSDPIGCNLNVGGGVVAIADQNRLPGAGFTVTLGGGGALRLGNGVTVARTVGLEGVGGGFDVAGGNTATFEGVIAPSPAGAQIVVGGQGTLNWSGSSNGAPFLVQNGGTLQVSGSSALSNSALQLFGGSLKLTSGGVYSSAITTTAAAGLGNGLDIGSNAVTLSGAVSGTGGLSKIGVGLLTITGANSFSGGFNLTEGSATLSGNGSIGSGPVTLSGANSVLNVSGINGGSLTVGALSGVPTSSLVLGTKSLTISSASNGSFSGSLSGSGGLTKSGSSNQSLLGVNTYSGPTAVSGGSLTINTANSLGASNSLSLTSGELALAPGSLAVTLTNALPFALNGTNNTFNVVGAGDTLELEGVISGAGGGFNKNGPGTLALQGANTFTAGTVLSEGSIILAGDGTLGTGSVLLGGGALQGSVGGNLPNAISVGAESALAAPPGASTTFSGPISGSAPLRIAGAGTVILTNDNTGFSGGVLVGSGAALRIATANNLGEGGLTLSGGVLEATGSSLFSFPISLEGQAAVRAAPGEELTLTGLLTGSGSLTVGGGGTVALRASNTYVGGTAVVDSSTLSIVNSSNFSGPLTLNSGTVQITSSTVLSDDVYLDGAGVVELAGQDVELTGSVSGVGGFTKKGPGTLTLSQANSFQGGLTIQQGEVILTGAGSIGSGPLDLAGSGASFNASGYSASPLALGGLYGVEGSAIVMGTVPLSLTLQGEAVFAGSLSGSGALTITGSGSQALLGASAYSGDILVDGSTLQIGSAASIGNSPSVTLQDSTLQTAPGTSIVWPSESELMLRGSNEFDVLGSALSLPAMQTTIASSRPGAITKSGSGTLTIAALEISNSPPTDAGTFTLSSVPDSGPLLVDALGLGPIALELQPSASGALRLGSVTMISNGVSGSTSLQRSAVGPVEVTSVQLSDGSSITNAVSGAWVITEVVKSPAAFPRPPAVLENAGGGLSVGNLIVQSQSAITDVYQSASTPLSIGSVSVGTGATLRTGGAGAGAFALDLVSAQGTVENDFPNGLVISGALQLENGLLRQNAGELDLTGALVTVLGNATLEVNQAATAVVGGMRLVGGTLIVDNNSSAASGLLLSGDLSETAPSTFDVKNDVGSRTEITGVVRVSNLNLSGGQTVFDDGVEASSVHLTGGATSMGHVQLGAVSLSNGSLRLNDAQVQTMQSLSITTGQFEAEDGADVTIGTLAQQGGAVSVGATATLTIPGVYDFSGGSLQGPGLIIVDEMRITGAVTVNGELHVRDFRPGPGNIAIDITAQGSVELESTVNMGNANILSAGRLSIQQDFIGGLIQNGGLAVIDGPFTMLAGSESRIGATTTVGGPLTVNSGASFSTAAGGSLTIAPTAESPAGSQDLILMEGSSGLFAQGSTITVADQILIDGSYHSLAAISAGSVVIGGSSTLGGGIVASSRDPILIDPGASLSITGPGVVLSSPAGAGVQVFGTLDVGHPLTINPTTNLTLAPSSLTRISVTPSSAATIAVAGTASLDGILQPVFGTGRYVRGSSVTLLAAAGGVSGVFPSVEAFPERFNRRIAISYTPNEVVLTFVRGGDIALIPCGANQRCWVAAVQSWLNTSPEGALIDWIETILDDVPVECSCKALALLTGEPYSDLMPLSFAEARLTSQSVQKQIWRALDLWSQVVQEPRGVEDGFGRFYPAKSEEKLHAERWRVWADGVGQYWRQGGEIDQALSPWNARGSSFDFGADVRAGEKGLIGAVGTVQLSHGEVAERASQLRLNALGASLYGSVFDPENERGPLSGAYLGGQVGGFGMQGRVKRSVHLAGNQQELCADVSGARAQGRLELGQVWRSSRGAAQPYVAAEVGWSRFSKFSEGLESPIALEGPRSFASYAAYLEVGARLYGVLPQKGWLLQPEIVWSYAHNFVKNRYEVPMKLTQIPGCRTCDFRGLNPVDDFVRLQLGVVAYLGRHIQLALRGNVEGSERWLSAGGNLQVSVGF